MKFSLFTDYGALNSGPVFEAFGRGALALGHEVTLNDYNADVAVVWSVLFQGRMSGNEQIWNNFSALGKPIIVLEVGSLFRQTTWRMAIGGINREAYFGPEVDTDWRAKKVLGLEAKPWKLNEDGHILICTQSPISRQWRNFPDQSSWLNTLIKEIRSQTDRKIVIRPHPRFPVKHNSQWDVEYESPKHVKNDVWDLDLSNVFAVVNVSSSPGIQAILAGVPAYVGADSMAFPVANHLDGNYNEPVMPKRRNWLNNLAFTEWTTEEIQSGMPLSRLIPKLEELLNE